MQASLERFKQRLSKHFNGIVASLLVVLTLLFYLTSLLSQSTSLTNTVVDILIYLIYFALIFTLGSLAFVVYNYFDEDDLLMPVTLQERPLEEVMDRSVESDEANAQSLDITMIIAQYKERLNFSQEIDLKGFKRLSSLSNEEMSAYLQQQHPQLIATMLAYMPTQQAEDVLARLDSQTQEDVIVALQESRAVERSSLLVLSDALYKDLSVVKSECSLLKTLSRLEVKKILRHVSKIELMFALKGASQELQEMFFVNMSTKASAEFQSVLATKRDVSPSKSDNAIKNLYLLAQRLREDGKIRAT